MLGEQPPTLHYNYESKEPGTSSFFSQFSTSPQIPLLIRREFYPQGDTGLHHHHADFLALYVVRGGKGIHIIDGNPYGITKGDVYLMPAGARHGYADHLKLEIDAFYFTTELFTDEELKALRSQPGFWALFANDGTTEHRFHLSSANWPALDSQVEEIRQEWQESDDAAPVLIRSGFFRLLIWLARALKNTPLARGEVADGIASAIQFCEENYAAPLTVSQLAARAFLSPGHFSDLFHRQVGTSPAAFLRRLRLEKARILLRETSLSAAQIAFQTGFGDAAHFTRSFRSAYGLTPTSYRKSQLSRP